MKPAASQQVFQNAVLAGDLTPGLFVVEGGDREGGIRIYVNAYRARLVSALKDNYPVLRLALGDDAFDELATAYIDANPSRFRSIRWLRDALREFLDTQPERIPHPALADLASMDWALRCAFDSADATLFTVDELARLAPDDWPALAFQLHPSASLLDLNWRIEPIWHQLNEDPGIDTDAPEPFDHVLLTWRHGLECRWRSLGATEAAALRAVAAGRNFAHVCERLAAQLDSALAQPTAGQSREQSSAIHAVSLLRQWLDQGLLVTLVGRLADRAEV